MSRAKDILNAIYIGLRQGVIKSPDIEFLYSDGPKRVPILQLVGEAISELSEPKPTFRELNRADWLDDLSSLLVKVAQQDDELGRQAEGLGQFLPEIRASLGVGSLLEPSLSDEQILHLWDAHVAYESNPNGPQESPLSDKDKLAFARAVLYAAGVGPVEGKS